MKETMFWRREKGGARCGVCARKCLIPDGKLGFCLVRKNIRGKLRSLNYGKIISMGVDPVEKKPLYHFYPGSQTFSIASAGCNFACRFCCNYEISQVFRDGNSEDAVGKEFSPQEIVDMAKSEGCKSISYTYTEPAVFLEFALDTARLAHKAGIKNTFVTNGYITPEAVRTISPYLDAVTVDFKGSADPKCYKALSSVPDVKPIFDSLLEMKRRKMHIEITNLIIPKYGDSMTELRKLARWAVDNLGRDTPFHILRFYPTYRLMDLPDTPLNVLKKSFGISKNEGLRFVYLGNVSGDRGNTLCPGCGELLAERSGMSADSVNLKDGKCPKCGEKINIVM